MNICIQLPRDFTSTQFSVDISDNTKLAAIRGILEQMRGKPFENGDFQQELSPALDELKDNKEFWAKVEAEGLRLTAELGEAVDKAVELQCVQSAQSGNWPYHPEQPQSIAEFLRIALQDTKHGSGQFYSLRWIVETFVPWCQAHGISIMENLWDRGTRTKCQYMAERLMNDFKQVGIYVNHYADKTELTPDQAAADIGAAAESKMNDLMGMVLDKNITLDDMREKHPVTQSKIPAIEAWRYVADDGDYYVFHCISRDQSNLIERLLGGKLKISLGTGDENFVDKFRK